MLDPDDYDLRGNDGRLYRLKRLPDESDDDYEARRLKHRDSMKTVLASPEAYELIEDLIDLDAAARQYVDRVYEVAPYDRALVAIWRAWAAKQQEQPREGSGYPPSEAEVLKIMTRRAR